MNRETLTKRLLVKTMILGIKGIIRLPWGFLILLLKLLHSLPLNAGVKKNLSEILDIVSAGPPNRISLET